MLGRRQRGKINVQPQPLLGKGMAQGPTFASKELVASLPEARHIVIGAAIEGARYGGLIGELGSPPSACQGKVWPQAGIDLAYRATARQDAHQHIQHFGGRRMGHGLQRHRDRLQHGGQKAGAHEAIAKHAQGGKVGLFRHRDQTDCGMHLPPPAMRRVLLPIVAHDWPSGAQQICYPPNFAQNQSVTLLAPMAKLDAVGLGDLVREQYGL